MKYAYCLLDTETTGLHRHIAQVYDIAWKFLDAQLLLATGLKPHPFNINGVHRAWVKLDHIPYSEISEYTLKSPNFALYQASQEKHDFKQVMGWLYSQIMGLKEAGYDDVYLVGANPAFDDHFNTQCWGDHPGYKYRLIDLENQAMKPMRALVPPGFQEVIKHYLGKGVTQPHSAEGDVLLLERVLLQMRERGDI